MQQVPWRRLVPSLQIYYNDRLAGGWRKIKGFPKDRTQQPWIQNFKDHDAYWVLYDKWALQKQVEIEKELVDAGFELRHHDGPRFAFHVNVDKWLAEHSDLAATSNS